MQFFPVEIHGHEPASLPGDDNAMIDDLLVIGVVRYDVAAGETPDGVIKYLPDAVKALALRRRCNMGGEPDRAVSSHTKGGVDF